MPDSVRKEYRITLGSVAQIGTRQLMRGAAANMEFQDRNEGAENPHYDCDGMAGRRIGRP